MRFLKPILFLLFALPILAWAQDTQTTPAITDDSAESYLNQALNMPNATQTVVEYQPLTGCYVLHTRIGDTDITTPILMTADEYKNYTEQKFIHQYWQTKISEVEHDNEKKFDITDMKFNIGPADKVFGPGGVRLKLQGSAELLFGFKHQYIDNPALTQRSRNNNIFDFDEKIQLNVNGTVGTRLSLQMNYNTEASFAADQQNIKIAYKGEEDDIIQSIQAGNVTLDLNSSLIKGSQALFGIKTDLKFGRLKVQALISQQNSQTQSASSEGGSQMTKFEVQADNYDENKHFFLSYYFRDNYEQALTSLPYVTSGVTINRIEVWVTNKRGTYDQARNIIAFTDLGEGIDSHLLNRYFSTTVGNKGLPQNEANDLYSLVKDVPEVRDIQNVTFYLQSKAQEWSQGDHEFTGGEDYDKIESARLLSSSDYTLNAALGYISLKTALQQDEVLAVAYEYTYGGKVYQVGEFSSDNSKSTSENTNRAPNLILKMLRSSNTAPIPMFGREKDRYGTWHLMMKNIYSLGASSMTSEKFELYVKYRNDSIGQEVQYLPEGEKTKGKQLIRVLNADRLDQRNNPYPDGRFDYVEGYTVLSSMGRVIFPVLEPFGSHLASQIDPTGANKKLIDKYCFQELYDSTLVIAQEMSEKNKYVLTGKYSGTNSSEIRLNAMNIPRGSVTVTAGGATLVENVDYTVDYTMGVVTILNQSLIESGTNIDVQLENQSTFGMQRRGLYGVHMEYEFNKDFTIGGTLMHLRESPLTTKVNLGSEPLANTIWGLNLNYRTEMMWLTNLLDKIPWMQVTAPSTFQIGAEFAQLIPGHTKDVGSEGTSYVDDFESTTTSIDVHYPSNWFLSSTPSRFPESNHSNNIEYGKNRAQLSWYIVDPIFGHAQTNTPQHIKDDPNILSDHRTRIVYQQELFPNKESLANEDTRLSVLNLTFYPKERGPYNIYPGGYNNKGELDNPKQRWGGMMRKLDNTDFEKSNIEYIEFWLMDPKLTNSNFQGAKLYIDLGDVSEDILRDGKKSFEHGLPVNPDDESMIEKTIWGRIPRTTSTTVAFSNEAGARDVQDVGLNGLSTDQEFAFEYNGEKPYAEYVNYLRQTVTDPATLQRWNNDKYSPLRDPAGDNYHYYRGDDYDEAATPVLERYKHYNGTEGNSPESSGQTYGTASTLSPDIEDINHDNTLGEYEKYYEYEVNIDPTVVTGTNYVSEKMETDVTLKNGKTERVTWYKFKVPVRGDSCTRVGGIRNYKSIRFMRLYLTGCSDTTTLRFATMDLVRGEWRNYTKGLYNDEKNNLYNTTLPSSNSSLDVQAVSIEQDGKRSPVNYVLPPGISRQTDPGQAQLISQNEQALVLRVHNLDYNNARAVYKSLTMDMRNYKQLKMFVHAEAIPGERVLQDNELSCFIRLGTDMTNNYYEYEVPLKVTPASSYYNNDNEADRRQVWPEDNNIDFPFSALTNAKIARNKAKRSGDINVTNTKPYIIYDDANGKPNNRITVLGNPTLEDVEYIVIGVRNHNSVNATDQNTTLDGEVWVNELRLSEFDESGGVAAMANMGIGVSDIAQLNMSGRVETAGYGSIESNVQSRNMENYYQFQVSAAMEMGRFFPEKAKLRIPLYVSYSKNLNAPKYDPTDTDVKLKESLETYTTQQEKDSIKNMANTVQESTSWSLTNFKVDIHSKKKDMFYDPANFTVSVAFNKQNQASPEIKKDFTSEHKGSFNYAYNFNPKPWEPFKKVEKVKNAKILTEFNLYYLPQSWSFNTDMHRSFTQLKMRDFNQYASASEADQSQTMSYSKDFTWNRNFDFKYDLTKNLKFSFHTAMNSTVDEGLYTPEIIKDYNFTNDYYEAWKDTVQRSMKTWGQPYTYQQVFTASWNVPFNRIPYMEWLTANASYNGTYTWNRTASTSSTTNFGNTAQSSRSWQVDGQANLETLYGKSDYWKQLNQRMSGRQNKRPFRPKTYGETVSLTAGEPLTITHSLNSETLIVTAVDKNGKTVKLKHKTDGGTKIIVTSSQTLQDVNITISTRNPNDRTVAEQVMDYAAYFGTMIRRVQVTYRQTDALTVPGFSPQIGFFGQDHQGGSTYAPGWDFAFGFYPSDYVMRAKDNGWLVLSDSVSQPATMAKTSDFDFKVTLEPFPGFKIQVNGKRYEARTSSLLYTRDLNAEAANAYAIQETMNGSYNITQVAIASAFEKIGKPSDNFASATFNRFMENRDIMQQRVQQRYNDVYYPTSDPSQLFSDSVRGQKYNASLGIVSNNSADVLVPAFLSAYTKQNVNKISFDPFLDILHILPNWNVTFDGIGRIPAVKEHFKSFVLTHAYTCKYAIGSYSSYSAWLGAGDGSDKTLGFRRDAVSGNPIPSSSYDITSTSLTESFSPLVGVNMTLKNSLLIKTEYRKQRTATLNINAVQLTEGNTDEFVLGTGYTIKDLNFTAKAKSGEQRKVSNDLKITADFSYKNVATILRKVEENLTQASSGTKVWGLKIGADYVISQKVNVQFYYDHQSTIPLISSSYPIKNDNLGINIKLMLTR